MLEALYLVSSSCVPPQSHTHTRTHHAAYLGSSLIVYVFVEQSRESSLVAMLGWMLRIAPIGYQGTWGGDAEFRLLDFPPRPPSSLLPLSAS